MGGDTEGSNERERKNKRERKRGMSSLHSEEIEKKFLAQQVF